jgi:hypothetical protein
MDWKQCRWVFEWDGSWRDLYVHDTTLADWQKLIDMLRESSYRLMFKQGESGVMPVAVADVFEQVYAYSALLSVNVGDLTLNACFFTTDEIEFDLDPREVRSELELRQLLCFMNEIAHLLGKDVDLTPENMAERALLRVHKGAESMEICCAQVPEEGQWLT